MHTGQHFDYELDEVFYKELGVRKPDFNMNVGKTLKERGRQTTHAYQTALLFERTAEMLEKYKPDAVMYLGDTNSVLSSVVVSRYGVPVIHIEAGGRSFDWRMPEEKNRIVIDHLSDVLYCYVPRYKDILLSEGIAPLRIKVIGNIIHDALDSFLPKAEKTDIMNKLKVKNGSYALVTLHREENTSTEAELAPKILDLIKISQKMPVVFPIMPRVRTNLEKFGLYQKLIASSIIHTKPLGFLEFLKLEKHAKLTISDSGTVQEESLILGVPCLITRLSTERPETIEAGATILANTNLYENAFRAIKLKRNWDRYVLNPTKISPSKTVFNDLIGKISKNFFKKSRDYSIISEDKFVQQAYGHS
jgi:UDP-N-acetylglucosamine 2-epimerase (non-hydrolysing)